MKLARNGDIPSCAQEAEIEALATTRGGAVEVTLSWFDYSPFQGLTNRTTEITVPAEDAAGLRLGQKLYFAVWVQ